MDFEFFSPPSSFRAPTRNFTLPLVIPHTDAESPPPLVIPCPDTESP